MVGDAGGADSPARRAALEAMLRRYLPPMRVYLMRRRRLGAEEADDLLQGFVGEKVLDGGFAAAADRERGRFRSFLLTCLDHYVVDQIRRERAGRRHVRRMSPEEPEPVGEAGGTHDRADGFDVAWARQVIDETLRRVREQCDAGGRPEAWGMFDLRVVGPTLRGEPAPPYEALVVRFGFASPTQASNALVTAKRLFERTLRSVVAEYAGGGACVEEELRDLRAVLSGARARSG